MTDAYTERTTVPVENTKAEIERTRQIMVPSARLRLKEQY
jgi:hypothetical protein